MAGLFDYQPDPVAQGLMGFAGGLLTPVSRGGGFGAGLLGANQGMAQARQEAMQIEQMKRQMAQDALRQKLIEAQVKETENQAAERMLKVEQDKRKQAAIDRFNSIISGQDAQIPQGFDMSKANPAQSNYPSAQLNSPQAVMAAIQAGYSPEVIKMMAESRDLGRPQVAHWQDVRMPDGTPGVQGYSKTGDKIGEPVSKAYQMERVAQGDRVTAVDPYKFSGSMPIFQSPDSKASNAVTMRGQNMVDARAKEALNQPKLHFDAERGILVNERTGGAMPVMQGGQPIGPKEKPLTESQGKAALFGTRATEADKVLTELEGKYSRPSVAAKAGLENVPLIGGALGSGYNLGMGKNEQLAEQAQRNFINAVLRQESGAVISPSEFENARKQYFPQPGDTPAVVSQKRQNRIDAINGFKTMAGPAGKFEVSKPSSGGWSIEPAQ